MKEVEVVYFRYSTELRNRSVALLGYKSGTCVYGIYWKDDVDGWVPAKWYYPSGSFHTDGRKSDLDVNIADLEKELSK